MHVTGSLRLVVAGLICAVAVTPRPGLASAPTDTVKDEAPADPFCVSLQTIIDAAPKGFASLRGAAKKDAESTWAATRSVPGGTECLVFGGTPAAYTCTLYADDDANVADWTHEDTVGRLKKCLAKDWTASEQVDGTHERTSIMRGSAPASVRVVSKIGSGDAYRVSLWIDAREP